MKKSSIKNHKKILAVIPARGGSKGIRRKNLRLLNNKPLIYYQIQNALNCKKITDIVITSDSEEILEYCSKFKVYLRKRPHTLALDNVTLDPVVYDAVKYIEKKTGKSYDIIITLQPTSPLLKKETLCKAIDLFANSDIDTLLPVVDATHLYWKEKKNEIIPDYKKRLNRQWLPKRYKETGAFLISKREIVNERTRFGKKVKIFLLDDYEGIDIDTPLDWLIAETLLKRLKIIFVVNGNEKIGFGHIYRVLTLADKFIGHEVIFLSYDNNEKADRLIKDAGYKLIRVKKEEVTSIVKKIKPDIVINDILDTSKQYIIKLKKNNIFVVNFEDLGTGADEANLVFNALYEKTTPKETHRFGYEFVCLNEKFYLYEPIEFREEAKTLFVSFGGVDKNNLTFRVLKIISDVFKNTTLQKVIVVLGPSYPYKEKLSNLLEKEIHEFKDRIEVYENVKNMPQLMRKCDLAITSNGRTVYELTSLGIPTVSIAQNDRETFHLFSRYHKGIKYLGIACNITNKDLKKHLINLIKNSEKRKEMYYHQIAASQIIKKGINRIIDEILSEYWRWKNEKD